MLTKTEIEILVSEYPFLWPTHVYGDLLGKKVENYDYSYCELSYFPDGWNRSFIPQFLQELKKILIKNNKLNDYFVVEAKAKGGYFYWLGNYENDEIRNLIAKYSKEIKCHCYMCGSKYVQHRSAWGHIVCDLCAIKDFHDL